MIIYFSATGNSKYTAQVIAYETNDKAVSILDITDKIVLKDGENLGIITPTYCWRLPTIVEEFLRKIKIENANNSYVYYIATYGTTSGQTDYYVKKYLKKIKIKLSASYSIKTVDNWVVEFNVGDQDIVNDLLKEEALQIDKIIKKIKEKKKEFISKDKKSLFLCEGAKVYYNKARRTKNFIVYDNCITCGICSQNCPVKAIKIVDGRPIWVIEQCTLCFGCLHKCPMHAIEYDGITKKNGQYIHPEFTQNEMF